MMIVQPTAEQTRQVTRSRKRAYSGPGFGPSSFDCLGIGLGLGLGLALSGGDPANPAQALGANCLQWCRADLGVTQVAGVLSQINDFSGGAQNYTAAGAAQPAWNATAGANSTAAITHDGIQQIVTCAGLALPAPGTTPTWVWFVVRQNAWTSTRRLFGAASGSSNSLIAYQASSSPNIMQRSGADANDITTLPVGTWGALQFYYSNSTNDFTRVNDAAPLTGVSAGNNSSAGGRAIGGTNGGLFSSISWSEIVIANVLPNPATLAWFSAYRLSRYGF